MIQEFFYHSFPRMNERETIDQNNVRALKILESIVKNGLLITPEVMKVPFELEPWHNPIVQHRCSFTLIKREQLETHCAMFGRFSIEWNTSILKEAGISPVMYLSLFDFEDENNLNYAVPKFLYRMMNYHEYARSSLSEVEQKKSEIFRVGREAEKEQWQHDYNFFEEMRTFFESLKNMVYPVENSRYTKEENEYYSQREWKLPASLIHKNQDGMKIELATKASLEQQKDLLEINYDFFGKEIDFYGNKLTRAQLSFFFKNIGDKTILEHANKIIVPTDCLGMVEEMLVKNDLRVPIETL